MECTHRILRQIDFLYRRVRREHGPQEFAGVVTERAVFERNLIGGNIECRLRAQGGEERASCVYVPSGERVPS